MREFHNPREEIHVTIWPEILVGGARHLFVHWCRRFILKGSPDYDKLARWGGHLEYPGKMSVGDALKDGNMTMEMNTSGLPSTATINITDRKVEGQESVTTPAGTWNCYKITYKGKMTIKMGPLPVNTNLDGTEWFAPGFGIVKTESKHGSTAITSIK